MVATISVTAPSTYVLVGALVRALGFGPGGIGLGESIMLFDGSSAPSAS